MKLAIVQLLVQGLSQQGPNISHFLLGFDLTDPELTNFVELRFREHRLNCFFKIIDLLANSMFLISSLYFYFYFYFFIFICIFLFSVCT